ncbi:MAG: ABC transporter substrate-binding protein, partial [Caulobacterales bacterium]|nr:ABC transporter substrate-binding protein [Caulobacterales bacterium]
VVLPEGGVRLLSLAPLLPYYDVDPRRVQFIGTSLWNDPDVAREPALSRGWFPAPDPEAREAFARRYVTTFGAEPERLAGLSYDAVALIGQLTRGIGPDGLSKETIERPQGFRGAEGLFRFLPDGTSERALAILQVRDGRFIVIDPAPTNFVTF